MAGHCADCGGRSTAVMDRVIAAQPARRRALRTLIAIAALPPWLAACGTRQAAVKPGYYRVRRGDTLMQISRQTGHSVEALRRWNRLSNANHIRVGQVLRVVPPTGVAAAPARSATARPTPAQTALPRQTPAPTKPAPTTPMRITLMRPAQGRMVQTYNGSSSRGITIANVAGTPVVAAAAGTVMYANDGLRAYGNLIIIQHDANYLTIYAHNRKLLVKEGQKVAQGQRIAEMGATGSHQVALYFELRHNGQAVDPSGAFK